MSTSNPVKTPFPPDTRLSKLTEEDHDAAMHEPYPTLVFQFMYLSSVSRPDITYTVNQLAKYLSNYGLSHWKAAKHLLRYLQGSRSHGFLFGNVDDPFPLFRGFEAYPDTFTAFTDSDWAQSENRKSISGYIIQMAGAPILWYSKQQTVVALSSCEAKYIACTHLAKELLWL